MCDKQASYNEGKQDFFKWMEKGWSDWLPLEEKSLERLPDFSGVYEVRVKGSSFNRLKGSTNILYIGCTDQRGLRKRVKGLIKGKHIARKRIARIINELQMEIEFHFKCVPNARQVEKELLQNYENQYLELPPCNHNIPK